MNQDASSLASTSKGFAQESSSGANIASSSKPTKKKRNLPGTPDPQAEVIALSPRSLMATNRFVCEICNKGFQRDQNLQLHRRGHNLPWKLKHRSPKDVKKRVYICPEKTCVHHDPTRALGDLTGIKKHYSRKHGEKKWKCERCSKKYAVQSDWKVHVKVCGTREYRCDCGTIFSRKDSFLTHRAFCDALVQNYRPEAPVAAPNSGSENEFSKNGTMITNPQAQAPVILEDLPTVNSVENLNPEKLAVWSTQGNSATFSPLGVVTSNDSNTFLTSSTSSSNLLQLNQAVQIKMMRNSTSAQAQWATQQPSSQFPDGTLSISSAASPSKQQKPERDSSTVTLSVSMMASLLSSSLINNAKYQRRIISDSDTASGIMQRAIQAGSTISSPGYNAASVSVNSFSCNNDPQTLITYNDDQVNTVVNQTSHAEAILNELVMNSVPPGLAMWNNPKNISTNYSENQVDNYFFNQPSQSEINFGYATGIYPQNLGSYDFLMHPMSSGYASGYNNVERQFLEDQNANIFMDNGELEDLTMSVDTAANHENQSQAIEAGSVTARATDAGAISTYTREAQTCDFLDVGDEPSRPFMHNELEAMVSALKLNHSSAQE